MIHFFSGEDLYDTNIEQVYILFAEYCDESSIVLQNCAFISVEISGHSLFDFEIDDDFSYYLAVVM